MSTEAVSWAMDEAPMLRTEKGKPDTTARYVLWALAEHAKPDGTNAHPSVLRVQYRTGLDERTVQRALRRLETAGLIKPTGTVQGRTKWRLVMSLKRPEFDWAELEAEAEERRKATAERVRRHRSKRVTHSGDVTETRSDSVTGPDVTHSESVSNALKERYVTHSDDVRNALNAPLTTNQPPPEPPRTKKTPASADAERTADAPPSPDLTAFGAFWLVYPKKRDKQEALKAWRAAIESGVPPQKIIDAATAYARERADQDPKYTKYPATWLNKGCYDDEPDPPAGRPPLRAVSGGYQPYKQPDPSVYENDQGF